MAAYWFFAKSYGFIFPSFICLTRVLLLWGLTLPDTLSNLLNTHSHFVQATDPRDKVYALRGLSRDILDLY